MTRRAIFANYRPIERTPGARQLSRLRHPLDAAVLLGRRDPDRDAQHSGRLHELGELDAPARLHLMTEAMKRAYSDRAIFLGDPATRDAPPARLMSKDYAAKLRAGIDLDRAHAGGRYPPRHRPRREGENTTHYSVVDRYGNAVSNTYTLNFSYGVGLVAEGTGILLNNELDDFAAKPGAPNAYGLIGGEANAPGPGKRPLSSMTPTIVLKDGKPFLVTGSPGGSRIITTVLQVIINVIDRNMPIAEAVAEPRIHHQWSPDEVLVERGLPADHARALKRADTAGGATAGTSANSILVTPRGLSAPPTTARAARSRRDIDASFLDCAPYALTRRRFPGAAQHAASRDALPTRDRSRLRA